MKTVRSRAQEVATDVGRHGIVYPCIATVGAYGSATIVGPAFDTVLFVVFAITAVVTGAGAMSGSPSTDTLHAGAGMTASANPGEQWEAATLVKLTLFGLGLALILTVHALWWA
jgi:hypothetical protein